MLWYEYVLSLRSSASSSSSVAIQSWWLSATGNLIIAIKRCRRQHHYRPNNIWLQTSVRPFVCLSHISCGTRSNVDDSDNDIVASSYDEVAAAAATVAGCWCLNMNTKLLLFPLFILSMFMNKYQHEYNNPNKSCCHFRYE